MKRGSRQSRRSACDRCKAYKLRCQRAPDPLHGDSCERCVRTRSLCTTTTTTATSKVPDSNGIRRAHSSLGAGSIWIAPATSQDHRQQQPGESSRASSTGCQAIDRETEGPTRHSSIDFSFVFAGDSSAQQPLSPRQLQQQPHQDSLGSSSMDDFVAFGDSAAVIPSPTLQSVSEGPPNPLQDVFELCARLVEDQDGLRAGDSCSPPYMSPPGSSSSVEPSFQRVLDRTTQFYDLLKSVVAATETVSTPPSATFPPLTQPEHPSGDLGPRQPRQSLPGGVSVSYAISPPFLHHHHHQQQQQQDAGARPVGPAHLDHASHPMNATTCSPSGTSVVASTGLDSTYVMVPRRKSVDILTATTLVTAYILLIRTWRQMFVHLQALLLVGLPGRAERLKMLPGLQIGGFHVQNNPSIQIMVLLELSFSMLQQIEACLGVTSHSTVGCGRTGGGARDEEADGPPAVLVLDPVCISIRETLLSQEAVRMATENEPPLKKVVDELKKQLEKNN